MYSGGASSPRTAARKISGHGGSGMASSLLPFLSGGDLQTTRKKRNMQSILVFFFLVFRSASL
jgi:hypothetical protein